MFFPGNNRMFQINAPFGGGGAFIRGRRLIEGAFILKILKKGGGVYSRGRLKEGGLLIEVIRYILFGNGAF